MAKVDTELKWKRSKSMDELRAEAYARYSKAGVSLVQELDNILRALAFQRETLETNMMAGQAFKGEFFDPKLVVALKELTLSYSSAVNAKIKLDKHMKQIAETMTYDEQVDAVVNFVQTMDADKRNKILRDLTNYHNEQMLGISGKRMNPDKVE